jgi:hypothetical protein
MRPTLLVTALGLALTTALPSKAGPVLDWHDISSQSILTGGRPGATPILDFAVVHAAVHDAVQAFEKRYEPYATDIQGASGSMAAAVARATHDVLTNRFPAQAGALATTYNNYLLANDIDADDPGVAVGQLAAAGMIALRADDGSFPAVPPPNFVGANLPGIWRPTPSYLPGPPASGSPMAFPWVADVTTFSVSNAEEFRCDPPPALNTPQYLKAYNEVKAIGSINSTVRTAEQTGFAYFWADNFPAQFDRLLRSLAVAHLDDGDSERMFALCWIAAADAFITTWDSKIFFAFWRPVTAIQEGNADGNAKTVGDANWQPLLNTPNYPDQSSGANAVSGSITTMLSRFFGTDEVSSTVTSNHPLASPNTRNFSSFSQIVDEVVEARIFQGIHFRFSDTDARELGKNVAKSVYKNTLRPLHGQADDAE